MQNGMFRKGLVFTILIVIILVLNSSVLFGTSIYKSNDKNIVKIIDFNIKSSSIKIKLNPQIIETKTINSKDIVVVNSEENESYPSMVMSGRNCLVAYERENEGNAYIYLSKSGDYGLNWTAGTKLILKENSDELLVNSPALCIEPFEKEAYGVFLSSLINTGIIGGLIIPDISEIQDISYFVLNFSKISQPGSEYSSFWNFSSPDIVYHYQTNAPWIIGYTGSTNYTYENSNYSCKDSLMFLYQDASEPTQVYLQWDHTIENCANLSIATNEESKEFYGICEKENSFNQDLLFFKGTYNQSGNEDPFLDIIYKNISLDISYKHPKIFVKDDDIYVVTETKINESSDDILIYHSSDEGQNWDEIDPTGNISAPPGVFVPKFPLLSVNSTDIVCTFIEDKNLYLMKSSDLGVNWSDPVRINNADFTVVEEYHYADMPDTKHIIWTDNRNGNYDIYSKLLFSFPPSPPTITGPTNGKINTEYNFTFNSIDPEGDLVKYYIDWGDNNTEWTEYVDSSVEIILKHSWSKKGEYTIKAQAIDIQGAKSDWSEFTVKMPRDKTINNMVLRFLENHPFLYQLLQVILQKLVL